MGKYILGLMYLVINSESSISDKTANFSFLSTEKMLEILKVNYLLQMSLNYSCLLRYGGRL